LDKLVIDQKLESLRRCTERVKSKLPSTLETLVSDIDLQDVIVLNLSRAIQICVDIAMHKISVSGGPVPQSMGQAFESLADQNVISKALALNMRKAVGFRNIAVHAYDNIDWEIVFAIAKQHVADFNEFAKTVA
jgi:uncharacterized protein YutE (UPF0331/DUF86 family)